MEQIIQEIQKMTTNDIIVSLDHFLQMDIWTKTEMQIAKELEKELKRREL